MKDPRFRGLCLVTFLDDSSRCVTGARLFTEATSENAVTALAEAAERFGTPAAVLSDDCRCFNGGRSKKSLPRGSWSPTAFEAALLDRGIEMINSRPYHPQTNGIYDNPRRGSCGSYPLTFRSVPVLYRP